MALAFLPVPLEGPAVAPLRARHQTPTLTFVEQALSPLVAVVCDTFVRDESPAVRKALRRVIKGWVKTDPAAVVEWQASVRGGLPKMLSAESNKARHRVKNL